MDGNVLMGRNYDFKLDTSALMVLCEPKDGYKSILFDNTNGTAEITLRRQWEDRYTFEIGN